MINIKYPEMVRGSIIKLRRRCGKKVCKCMDGNLHESWALSYSEKGRMKMISIKESDFYPIKKAIKNYQKQLGVLEKSAMRGNLILRRELSKR